MKRTRLFRLTAYAAFRWLKARRFHPAAWKDIDLRLLACVVERKDYAWPWRVGKWVRGRDVLDVGCGRNLQSIGFLAAGARSYTGMDPTLDIESTVLKDSTAKWGKRTDAGISPRSLMDRYSRIHFVTATLAEYAAMQPGSFDVIVMHNVTEHLMTIGDEFQRFATLLRDGGSIVFRHPNYYCWHGHHLRPRTISEIIPGDPEQAAVMDWAHVRFDPVRHEWIGRTQNRIRLDDLRALTEQYFTIEQWEESQSETEQGIERLTPEILARYPEFQRRDLAMKAVFVTGRKRSAGTSTFSPAASAR